MFFFTVHAWTHLPQIDSALEGGKGHHLPTSTGTATFTSSHPPPPHISYPKKSGVDPKKSLKGPAIPCLCNFCHFKGKLDS